MGILAMVLCLAGLTLCTGVRVYIQRRLTGSWDFLEEDRARPSPALAWLGALGFVAILAVGFVGPGASLAGLPPISPLAAPVVAVVGVVLAVAGIAATFGSQLAMGASWRIGGAESRATDLVTGGPFGIVRNPVYASGGVTALGLALMVPNLITLAGVVALAAAGEILVRGVEEPYLRRAHGAEYARYAASVGRFVPGIGRLRR